MLRRLASTIAALVVLLSCTSPARVSTSTSSDPATEPGQAVLSIKPAGYRLAAPVQRSVAVGDGRDVLIAGGLDAAGVR